MKKLSFLLLSIIALKVNAQNTFPPSGNVGIGTSNPQGILQVEDNGRHYYVNKAIPGVTADGTGINYLLLHKIYTTELFADHHVMGKITAMRGNETTWNRKWTIEVNTASALSSTRGSIMSYNEGSRLVTLTYNNEKYLAAFIQGSSAMWGFSFTGYAEQESFQLVYQSDVSDVQEFTPLDPITIQGPVGAGTILPQAPLHVAGNAVSLNPGNANQYSGNLIIEGRSNGRNMNEGASLEFVIPANADGTNTWGQGRITTVAGNTGNGNAVGKMVLGTRRYFNKLNTGVEWYYGDDLTIDGVGNVGIGTLAPTDKLSVNGTIRTKKVVVTQTGWADYVFAPSYKLPSLDSVATFIETNKHLPDIPSEKEVLKDGHDLGEMQKLLLKKVEELTLYVIELKKKNDNLETENIDLKKRMQIVENKTRQ